MSFQPLDLRQRGLDSAGKVRSLRLTSPGSIPAASAPLLVGLRPELHNTTIKAPILISQKIIKMIFVTYFIY